MIPLLFAAMEPPADLSTWVGGIVLTTVLTAIVTALITNYAKSGDKVSEVTAQAASVKATADAEWKAELRADLKRLIEVQNQLVTGQGLQSKDITGLTARLDALEKRQEQQAAAHLREIDAVRQESSKPERKPRR